ncbi:hypothetical protein SLS62_006630 [Diatrype stigma]|uniref:Uncharacterized protein n=1 Tax=Diatrype stigma TaxID=117547 RepID=A0AAN9UMA7_9PEZI
MDGCLSLRGFASRLQRLIGLKSKVQTPKRRSLQISAPFNFKHESVILPGVSEDEIAILKEKAAASRLGVASEDSDAGPAFGSPRRAPAPPSGLRPVTPTVQATPSTPLSPAGNVI